MHRILEDERIAATRRNSARTDQRRGRRGNRPRASSGYELEFDAIVAAVGTAWTICAESCRSVINATGVILAYQSRTRAFESRRAMAIRQLEGRYSNIEYDLSTGERVRAMRQSVRRCAATGEKMHWSSQLCCAVLLVLDTLAKAAKSSWRAMRLWKSAVDFAYPKCWNAAGLNSSRSARQPRVHRRFRAGTLAADGSAAALACVELSH